MINISIVTGTFNRLPLLRTMVESVRSSVGRGLSYEIIVVDGGSTDGTINWCKQQNDIVLIRQGQLLGAVKAFNEGAAKARGEYVILANDDVTFVYESIARSFAFMQDNLHVGIGCFYQNRRNKDWHVEKMPAIDLEGKRINTPYGQVCIIPKWLGDQAGWWGDYLYTYGGDNELSCKVLEIGYAVTPIECACIRDSMHNDQLRRINNSDRKDTLAFRERWPKGPTLGTPKIRPERKRPLRLLYAPIYEPGNLLQKKTKFGLLQALRKKYNVLEVDYLEKRSRVAGGTSGIEDLYYSAQAYQPDVFLLQLHDAKHLKPDLLAKIKEEHPNAIFISWNGDYSPRNFMDQDYRKMLRMMDLSTFVAADIVSLLAADGINSAYWQIGYEEFDELTISGWDKQYDVIFQGNEYSEQRTYLGHILREMSGIRTGIFGFWRSLKADGVTYYDYAMQDKLYRCSKICISDQQFKNSIGYTSNRLFQAMYSGCFVLQQRIPQMGKYLKLVDGEHLVIWNDISELPEMIHYWLVNEAERRTIAENGKKLVMREHNFDCRVQEFNQFLLPLLRKG